MTGYAAIGMLLPDSILDVLAERNRQDAKWGEQNHHPMQWLSILGEEYGETCQGANKAHFGGRSWDEYREEMVQVAAVAIAAIECLDRGKWRSTDE